MYSVITLPLLRRRISACEHRCHQKICGALVVWSPEQAKKSTKVHLDRAPPRRQHLWTLLVQAFSPFVNLLVNPYLF